MHQTTILPPAKFPKFDPPIEDLFRFQELELIEFLKKISPIPLRSCGHKVEIEVFSVKIREHFTAKERFESETPMLRPQLDPVDSRSSGIEVPAGGIHRVSHDFGERSDRFHGKSERDQEMVRVERRDMKIVKGCQRSFRVELGFEDAVLVLDLRKLGPEIRKIIVFAPDLGLELVDGDLKGLDEILLLVDLSGERLGL